MKKNYIHIKFQFNLKKTTKNNYFVEELCQLLELYLLY